MSIQPGGDAAGRDPTANVLRDIAASERRQDDLRKAEGHHLREMIRRDREHARDLRLAEAARLDAIRVVDVNAVQRAAEVMAAQAQTLAAAVASTEATLRKAQEDAASRLAAALESVVAPMKTDIRELRESQAGAIAGRATAREGEGDRRASTGLVVAVVGAVMTFVFAVTGVALTLLLRSG